MNLLDMANLACAKCRSTDSASVTRAKEFLNRRNHLIWNEALWRASVYRHDFTYEPDPDSTAGFGNYFAMPANSAGTGGGVVMLPEMVDRVLGLRRADGEVRVDMAEAMFRTTLDQFDETGQVVKFNVLPAAVATLERYTAAELQALGVTIEGAVDDEELAFVVRTLDWDGERRHQTVTLDANGEASLNLGTGVPRVILSVGLAGEPTAAIQFFVDGLLLGEVPAGELSATRRARILLLPRPVADTALKCLVKKKAEALTEDGDEPEIPAVENCLIALAAGDLMQSQRSAFAKAQQFYEEGAGLLEQLKRMETVQQSSSVRFVPEVDEPAGTMVEGGMGKGWFS